MAVSEVTRSVAEFGWVNPAASSGFGILITSVQAAMRSGSKALRRNAIPSASNRWHADGGT
jgi:hypothetical protein